METGRKKRVYVSGPISGCDIGERKREFEKVCSILSGKGFSVTNPLLNGLDENARYEEHMKEDISELLRCDSIYLLKGWGNSSGCQLEYQVAKACGMEIIKE